MYYDMVFVCKGVKYEKTGWLFMEYNSQICSAPIDLFFHF